MAKTMSSFSLPFVTDDAPDTPEMERRLAREFASLSVQERDSILDDVHGAAAPTREGSEDIDANLRELDACLARMPRDEATEAYHTAVELRLEYVASRRFRLQFLRVERYQPLKAAGRLSLHLRCKLEIFGLSLFQKEHIELDDLDQGDIYALDSNYITQLPMKDMSGRAILFVQPVLLRYYRLENIMRMYWYVGMTTLREESVQLNGVVYVAYSVGKGSSTDFAYVRATSLARHAIPMKICANHLLMAHSSELPLLQRARYSLEQPLRLRFRGHTGSREEMLSSLRGYGISLLTFKLPGTYEIAMAVDSTSIELQRNLLEAYGRARKRRLVQIMGPTGGTVSDSDDDTTSPSAVSSPSVSSCQNRYLVLSSDDDSISIDFSATSDDDSSLINYVTSPSIEEFQQYEATTTDLKHDKDETEQFVSSPNINALQEYPTWFGSQDAPQAPNEEFVAHSDCVTPSPSVSPLSTPPSSSVQSSSFLQPRAVDVLLGHGACNEHPGNVRLRRCAQNRYPEYAQSNKTNKGKIVKAIVQTVFDRGGRFLKREDEIVRTDAWIEADTAAARKKVSNILVRKRF